MSEEDWWPISDAAKTKPMNYRLTFNLDKFYYIAFISENKTFNKQTTSPMRYFQVYFCFLKTHMSKSFQQFKDNIYFYLIYLTFKVSYGISFTVFIYL